MARRVRKQTDKKKQIKGGANKKVITERLLVENPETMYITAWPHVSVDAVANHFGMNAATMRGKAAKEGWTSKRTAYWAEVNAKAMKQMQETTSAKIIEANERHVNIGKGLEGLSARAIQEATNRFRQDKVGDVKTDAMMRAGAQTAKAGVDIERKGLGLADTVLFIQNMEEFTSMVIVVLQRELGGHPDLLENAIGGIREGVKKAKEQAAEVIEASYDVKED